ncbi:MAG: lysylphosphatidylglycerol synthase transmembrane domain-containing protein [Candidatus Cryptobacteroides sp.]|nr:lysylphosphatidylglycerol synthase transmembrane domain-containing protein [Candidatus Cryptobacteroides sp.]
MKKNFRNILKYILSLVLAAVLLWFCFREVNWQEFLESLKGCRWEWVMLSILAGVLSNWFRAERWREILLPLDAGTSRRSVFNSVNIAYLANFIFPRIGEFVRCGVVSRDSAVQGDRKDGQGLGYDKVLGTVVTERSIDLLMMFGILVGFLCLKWNEFGAFFIDNIWLPVSGRLNLNLWWIAVILLAAVGLCVVFVVFFRDRNVIASKLWSILKGVGEGLVSCFRMKNAWKFILHSVLIWLMYFLMSYTSMRAVPLLDSLGLPDAMFLMLVGSLGWLVPVPGGFGAFHYIVALALSTVYSLPFELGIIFATISHESQSIMMALTGLVSYADEIFRHR